MVSSFYNSFLVSLLIFSDGFVSGLIDEAVKDIVNPLDLKLLTFLTPFGEELILKHTGKSIEVNLISPLTVGTAFGGSLGSEVYRLHKFIFYWQSGFKSTLQSRIIHYKVKYGTFEEAAKHEDGLLDVFVPIETNGDKCNPLFDVFEKKFEKIEKPGDWIYIKGGESYGYYNHFNYTNVYSTSSGSNFYDDEIGKSCKSAMTIKLQPNKDVNFIGKEQFEKTFGSIKDCSGNPLNNPIPLENSASSAVESKGICIINLPI